MSGGGAVGAGAVATPPEVPFVDLRAQHEEVREEIEAAFRAAIDASAFVGGAPVERFEAEFAGYVGVRHAVGVGSGTDAVRIALQAVGVEAGDAVLTVAHTFIATAEGATQAGALPLFVDVEPGTLTMDPGAVESFLRASCRREDGGAVVHEATGRRVSALLPVHLYGQPARMEPLLALAREFDLPVVEDAAQAHGARYRFASGEVRSCGALGRAAAFSFYPGKNLGAMGEAGAVVTDDPDVAERARVLRDHGQTEKYLHAVPDGSNARLDAIQAAVLGLKLMRLDGWNDRRRDAADQYDRLLADLDGVERPTEAPYARHVYHLYAIQVEERDRLQAGLGEAGIATGLHYPIPLHRQKAYAGWPVQAGPLPTTERAAERVLSLPMFPHLSSAQIEAVADRLQRLVG